MLCIYWSTPVTATREPRYHGNKLGRVLVGRPLSVSLTMTDLAALSWNAGLDRMGMQTMKQKILGFTKTQHIQHQETMKWDDTSLTFYVK